MLLNRVKMSVSNTPSNTSSFTLASADAGFQSFASAGAVDGAVYSYMAVEGNTWEIGIGTYTASGTTLSRDTVDASSAGGTTKATFSSAVKVAVTALVRDLPSGKATGSDVRTGTDDIKFITAKSIMDAMNWVTLTDAATVAVDFNAGLNFKLTIGGNRTLGAPSNAKPGESGCILITQDNTGSRTLAYNSAWKFPGGAPTLSTAANTIDMITYVVDSTSVIRATLLKGFA